MNYRFLGKTLGMLLIMEAAMLLIPTAVSAIYGEQLYPFLISVAILLAVGLPAQLIKVRNNRIYTKEGFVCVAAAWVMLSAFGALPFVFSGAIPNYIDALFETVSGFTTTGSTILSHIEDLPRGILFWRSFTHWVGGMGVLMFMLALLPSDDGQSIHLMKAEVPGPTKGKIVPKMNQTARILYGIYIFLTVAETVALRITGMPWFDSVVNSFATTGTGGFSVRNISIEAYANPAAEWVITVFMFLCGINFNMFYFLIIRRFRDIFRNEELKAYFALCFGSVAIIAANTWNMFAKAGDCIRAAFFQVTTIMSTTGFSTTNFDLWPQLSRTVLVLLMLIGACAGSTAGGLKISRMLIILKNTSREIKHVLRPKSVNVVKLDGEPLPEETVRGATNYFSMYMAVIILSILIISIDNFGFETNTTAVISCMNNIGPGLGMVGPAGNFGAYSALSKIVLTLDMLIGRLEIFPMVVLLSPLSWKKR